MREYQKRKLYEQIMREVAQIVKTRIYESERQFFIDLDNIPEELVRAANVDLSKQERFKKYHSVKIERVYESTFSEEIEEVGRQLQKKYGLQDWQYLIADLNDTGTTQTAIQYKYPNRAIEIVIANIGQNVQIINQFMESRGFELIRRNVDEYPKIPETFVHLIYTEKFVKDIRNDLMQKRYIYHCTPSLNKESIIDDGLLPKERNFVSGIKYKPRTYFFVDGNIANFRQYAISTIGPEHILLVTVDMKKVPQNIQFFYDPLYGKESVYTEDVIPPEAIESIINLF